MGIGIIMIHFLIYLLLFFIAAVLQTVLIPRVEILDAEPSLLLILIVICALRHGTLAGCFMGFVAGLFCDVYAPIEWLGAYSLSFCIVGFTVGQIEESIINLNLLPKIVVLAIVCFLNDLIYFFAIGKNGDEILNSLFSVSIPNAIYTLILGTLCFYLINPFAAKKKYDGYKI